MRQTSAGTEENDILVDLRVDDHTDPVPEMIVILGIHQLLFGKSPADEFLPLEGALADEVSRLLADRGFDSLDAYAGVENLEERMWPDGSRIDPAVLEILLS